MIAKEKKDRLYFRTLLKLNDYIEANHQQEGFLPPENRMSELFGVSRITYRAALAAFRQNGFIVSYPKRGHYVQPRHYWVKKVGLVIREGKECPFLPCGTLIAALVEQLETHGMRVQIIQSSLLENIRWRALAHGVKALVWVMPDPDMFPLIYSGVNETPFSQLVLLESGEGGAGKKTVPCIAPDRYDMALRKVRFFQKRGHLKIALLEGGSVSWKLFTQAHREVGMKFDRSLLIGNKGNWEERFLDLAKLGRFTAVVASGGQQLLERTFQILNSLPGENCPEVLLPTWQCFRYFRKKYPRVNMVGSSHTDWTKLGRAAADAVARNILKQKPIVAQQVKSFQIRRIP